MSKSIADNDKIESCENEKIKEEEKVEVKIEDMIPDSPIRSNEQLLQECDEFWNLYYELEEKKMNDDLIKNFKTKLSRIFYFFKNFKISDSPSDYSKFCNKSIDTNVKTVFKINF
jgi:hypothetical protein